MAMGLSADQIAAAAFSFFFLFLAVAYGDKISNREYLALKRQLKTLNRPGVKVIKTKYGDIYDCVDIYKQPSLDHPLLKNHTVQRAPSYTAEVLPMNVSGSGAIFSVDISLPDGGCPEGTVPLQRLTVDDLIWSRTMTRMKRRQLLKQTGTTNHSSNDIDFYQHHYAVIIAREEVGPYFGFSAIMNVWLPGIIGPFQTSIAQMWLSSGLPHVANTIEVGWMVNPRKFYSNQRVFLFTYWTSDGYRNGCYNRDCPGFVNTNPSIGVPSHVTPVSTYNGDQFELALEISKDPETGNWWLRYGFDRTPVGYWPSEMFPLMRDYAESIRWGGEVLGTNNHFPPMGSGHFATEGLKKACFMRNVKKVEPNGGLAELPTITHSYMTDNTCYTAIDYLPDGGMYGRHTYFGGPGGVCRPPPA